MNPKKLIITLIVITLVLTTLTAMRTKDSLTEPKENAKVEQSVDENKNSLKNKFSAFDVPLDEDLQLYIFELSERYSVPMELIIAVIGQESNYDPSKIGDNHNSYGLMQVQPKWHEERMVQYNVTDLLNPYENCLIGVDYLAECLQKGGLEWGLMAYNGGPEHANNMTAQGVITEYAESVIYLSENL